MQLFNSLVTAAMAVASVLAQGGQLSIQTPPAAVVCQPVAVTFGGGTGPYFVALIPGGQVTAPAIESFGQQSGPSYTWKVDQAPNTSLTLKVTDSTGTTAYSGIFTIQSGPDTSCVGKGSAAGSATSGAASPTNAAPSSAPSGSSGAASQKPESSAPAASGASPSSGAASAPASGASSAASAATSKSNAAALIPGSAAGILGGLLAAIIA